ncbi:hypothetical protein SUDANB105_07135 [Streptomyces sp. enrichment culture]|uniref:hypothetical protein n=1 Tax=Streptomyces sp. enrichment culture TaxID=1795815 RepID=UPI003F542C28
MPDQPRVVLLKPLVKSPLIEVGEYSCYDDPDDPTACETRNVLHHYGPQKQIIGKFCAPGTHDPAARRECAHDDPAAQPAWPVTG